MAGSGDPHQPSYSPLLFPAYNVFRALTGKHDDGATVDKESIF